MMVVLGGSLTRDKVAVNVNHILWVEFYEDGNQFGLRLNYLSPPDFIQIRYETAEERQLVYNKLIEYGGR